jgi:Novel STAND NTPase 1
MRPTVGPDQARVRAEAPPPRAAPYQGLRPFAEEDAAFFFGRDTERTILVANLMAARLTLVYGESGVGKSSILRAGVVYHLRAQERVDAAAGGTPRLLVVYLDQWSGDPVARLLDRVGEEIARALGREAPTVQGSPASLAASLAAWTARWNLDLLVILDQFEEYFLYHPDEDGSGTFAAEFAGAVNRSDLPVSFLVAIREDGLAKLDRFKGSVPNLFENYVRIRHLRASQAEAAVLGPLARLGEGSPGTAWTAEPELVRRVLEGVQVGKVVLASVGRGVAAETGRLDRPDPPIETPYLQMVLTRLWAEETARGSRRLRLATLEALGGPQRIVRTHLDEALDRLPVEQQEVAARVFHYLVTSTGCKVAHTATDLAAYAGISEEQVRSVLGRLSAPDARILRTVAAPPGQDGEPRHEIFHDVLAPAILGWRARWVAERQAHAAAERQLQRRTRRWRRRRAAAAVLVGVVLVALCGLLVAARRTTDRAETAAIVMTGAAQRSATDAYVAQADTFCVEGWAAGRQSAPPPRPELDQPGRLANWLDTRVRIGRETSRHWKQLKRPPGAEAKQQVLKQYDRGLEAYNQAATLLAARQTEAAGSSKLREADRIGVAYRALAKQNGYNKCATALPLPPPRR